MFEVQMKDKQMFNRTPHKVVFCILPNLPSVTYGQYPKLFNHMIT